MTFIISCVVSVPSFAHATTCSLSNVTTNSVRLSWPSVTGATRYTFNYGSGNVIVSSDATSVNVNGLTPDRNYKFLVTVYGQSGTGNTIACDESTGKLSALNIFAIDTNLRLQLSSRQKSVSGNFQVFPQEIMRCVQVLCRQ